MQNIPTYISICIFIDLILLGLIIGSFLNVLINRIPRGESIKLRSHCEACGCQLRWYDLIPVFSFLFLGGKCRRCKASISIQHPLIEVLNGLLYVLVYLVFGNSIETVLYCLLMSALLALSVIDFRTQIIPDGFNIFILGLGIVRVLTDFANWKEYLIGFFAVSAVLWLIYQLSGGRAIGGGDVKLMATAGLLLGWKLVLFSFIVGCILGSVLHSIRMKVSKADHVLAMGPYLSAGLVIAIFWGNAFISWYLTFLLPVE